MDREHGARHRRCGAEAHPRGQKTLASVRRARRDDGLRGPRPRRRRRHLRPDPLDKTRDPDLSHVTAAVGHVAAHLRAGQLAVLESTTYPGAVEEVVRPRLEASGLRVGADFFPAHSPERIDPGRRGWITRAARRSSAASARHRRRLPPPSTA